MRQRFEFAWSPAYRAPALLLGVRPQTTFVAVTRSELRVRFGLWRLVTPRSNIADCELTGDFRWIKTAGPPRLALSDRGVTFATNGSRALCITFVEPVSAIDPTGRIRHPNATLTVARPHLLLEALTGHTPDAWSVPRTSGEASA